MTYSTIIAERLGHVTLIRLNRPDALNALNAQTARDLAHAFAQFDEDDAQRSAVLIGSRKAFAAGADIKEMQDKGFAATYGEDYFSEIKAIATIRKPWIAAVSGYVLGGGCELAMMADFIVAADNARFGQPEIKVGVIPGMGGTQRLARAIGKSKTMDMCLTGRMMDAAEAERLGLVSRLLPLDQLESGALHIASQIAAMAPLAAMANKEAINFAFESSLSSGLQFERRLFQAILSTDDKSEGMAAFAEKREPIWKGS